MARYEGVLHGIPNRDVLLSPLTTQEAVLSSRIEGTQATFGEVLEFEAAGESPNASREKVADIQEILNYRAALRAAVNAMETLPLSQRVFKESHRVACAARIRLPATTGASPTGLGLSVSPSNSRDLFRQVPPRSLER